MKFLLLTTLFFLGTLGIVRASDVTAQRPITGDQDAPTVCEETCSAYKCGWSGEWRHGTDGAADVCDCGIERTRMIPGGTFRSAAEAAQGCNEVCDLNEDKWDGQWSPVPGGFATCGCRHVAEYCPTD
ncbi:hypothetical protein JCM17960_18050 [Magnetospira thiophila]